MRIFGKKKPEPTATVVDTFDYAGGPKSNPSGAFSFTRRKGDWSPDSGLLWVRHNNGEYKYTEAPDNGCIQHYNIAMSEADIVAFVSECIHRGRYIHLVVLTRDAHGMFPRHMSVEVDKKRVTVESSFPCTTNDVDATTMRLIQNVIAKAGKSLNLSETIRNWNRKSCLKVEL